jgi:hypothetical protein
MFYVLHFFNYRLVFGRKNIAHNVPRATRSLGFGERDVLSSTNVAKVDNVSIKHNTQIFGARCYLLEIIRVQLFHF